MRRIAIIMSVLIASVLAHQVYAQEGWLFDNGYNITLQSPQLALDTRNLYEAQGPERTLFFYMKRSENVSAALGLSGISAEGWDDHVAAIGYLDSNSPDEAEALFIMDGSGWQVESGSFLPDVESCYWLWLNDDAGTYEVYRLSADGSYMDRVVADNGQSVFRYRRSEPSALFAQMDSSGGSFFVKNLHHLDGHLEGAPYQNCNVAIPSATEEPTPTPTETDTPTAEPTPSATEEPTPTPTDPGVNNRQVTGQSDSHRIYVPALE